MNPDRNPSQESNSLYTYTEVPREDTTNTLAMVRFAHDPPEGPPDSPLPMFVLIVSTLIALLLAVRIWKSHGPRFEKLFWSVFLFVPFFGPLFFLVFYPGRSELEARRWTAMSSVHRIGGGGTMGL